MELRPTSELIELAKKELAKIGLASRDDVIDGCVVRQTKAYPVYDEDYKRQRRRHPRRSSKRSIRPCISSAAMACTSTTTRTTR